MKLNRRMFVKMWTVLSVALPAIVLKAKTPASVVPGDECCPECGVHIGDVMEECEIVKSEGGEFFNSYVGATDHWFVVELECPYCKKTFDFSGSSL